MKIAVVGAGVSGLVAAHLLSREHAVTLFEANDYAGGHTHTVDVETDAGRWAVDTGFIVLNDRNYANFERLLGQLEVATQPSDMSFSVADASGRFEYAATSLNGLYATRANIVNPRFARMILEVPRFQRTLTALLEDGDDDISLADLLAREKFSPTFVNRLIVPQVAAVWSADPSAMQTFPARFLAQFFANHGMLSLRDRPTWRVIRGGSRTYVEAICRGLGDRLRLNTAVRALRRVRDGVELSSAADPSAPEIFDRVILATHADQALALLTDASDIERELLGALPYQANEAVLHTDASLLPHRHRAWASWNYHLSPEPSGRAAVTYHMNRLQSLDAPEEFCVTLNHSARIDPARVIARFDYAHPVFTPAGIRAQHRVAEISGTDRVHFCGAYWGWGFHEDGVVSALAAVKPFGARL